MKRQTPKKEPTLGQRIRQLRREREWSQEEFGQKIDVHEQTIIRYEKDAVIPTATVLKKMSEVFGVSIDYLVFGDIDSTGMRVQNKELFKRFQQLDRFNPEDLKSLIDIMDLVIHKQQVKDLATAS